MPLPALLIVAILAGGCEQPSREVDLAKPDEQETSAPEETAPEEAGPGRLTARPPKDVPAQARTGRFELSIGDGRQPLLFVPDSYDPRDPPPFALALHGRNGAAAKIMRRLRPYAEDNGFILLAAASRGPTWDAIFGDFGPDVEHVDAALSEVFSKYAIDRRHLAVQGYSDGGSYALSLGITNGDLFSHVIAFSAGFMAPGEAHGSPRIYTSHGTSDPVTPIGSSSRKYVPQLRRAGYDVVYTEFEGGHRTPQHIATEAIEWFLDERRS